MLGFYDYTVVLTYCSVISAVIGIYVSLSGAGHPYIGVMLLLLCGLFDTFDGRVARSKKNRTEKEKAFGVQIDSLSDLVAFGVLRFVLEWHYTTEISLILLKQEGKPVITYSICNNCYFGSVICTVCSHKTCIF